MLSRRRLLSIAAGGVATMGVAAVTTAQRYDPLSPETTPISVDLPADTASVAWQEHSRWTLPGEVNCLLPQQEGRVLVGGEQPTSSGTGGYLASLRPERDPEIHPVGVESQSEDRVSDITRTQDGLVALQTAGGATHRLLRVTSRGEIQAASSTYTRDTELWFPRLSATEDGLRLAGIAGGRSTWADGVGTVRVNSDGTPRWSRTYGYGIEPTLIRGNAGTLLASVRGHSDAGLTTGLLSSDRDGLRYQRQLPDREIYGLHLISDAGGDAIVTGATDDAIPQRGFVGRIDSNGRPLWWRTIEAVTLNTIIPAQQGYRIQGRRGSNDDETPTQHLEFLVSGQGNVSDVRQVPEAVYNGHFRDGYAVVIERTESPQVVVYRDALYSQGTES